MKGKMGMTNRFFWFMILMVGLVSSGCTSLSSPGKKKGTDASARMPYYSGKATVAAPAATAAKPVTAPVTPPAAPAPAAKIADKKEAAVQKPAAEPARAGHVHMKFKNKNQENEYLSLVRQRDQIIFQVGVLNDLQADKKLELGKSNQSLSDQFGIDANRNYEYDAKSQTISELVPGKTTDASGAAQVTRRTLVTLDQKDKVDAFVRLAGAKKVALDAIRVLSLIDAERQVDFKACEESLASKFGLKRDVKYEYDAKTSQLYEVPARADASR